MTISFTLRYLLFCVGCVWHRRKPGSHSIVCTPSQVLLLAKKPAKTSHCSYSGKLLGASTHNCVILGHRKTDGNMIKTGSSENGCGTMTGDKYDGFEFGTRLENTLRKPLCITSPRNHPIHGLQNVGVTSAFIYFIYFLLLFIAYCRPNEWSKDLEDLLIEEWWAEGWEVGRSSLLLVTLCKD